MKTDVSFFIDTVMSSIDVPFVSTKSENDKIDFLFSSDDVKEDFNEYDGSNIVVSFTVKGDGLVIITAYNDEYTSSDKLIYTEDNLDIDVATEDINNLIKDIATHIDDLEKELLEEPVNYNDKFSFDEVYNTKPDIKKILVKPYLDKDGEVLLVFNYEDNSLGDLVCYAHEGQHSSCDPYYLDELKELNERDKNVKSILNEYRNAYLDDNEELVVVPVGTLLPVQEKTHKEIVSGD